MVTAVFVKVAEYPASHSCLMLMRLFVNCGIICPDRVRSGSAELSSVAVAAECKCCPVAVLTVDVGAQWLMSVTGAVVMK